MSPGGNFVCSVYIKDTSTLNTMTHMDYTGLSHINGIMEHFQLIWTYNAGERGASNVNMSVGSGLERLTRRDAIKMVPMVSCSVEECGLAVGQVVGYDSVKSASRMNSAVVIFLDSVEKVNQVVQSGVVIQGSFTPVLSLVSPARRIIISHVPPFIQSEVLEKELGRHVQLLSPLTVGGWRWAGRVGWWSRQPGWLQCWRREKRRI